MSGYLVGQACRIENLFTGYCNPPVRPVYAMHEKSSSPCFGDPCVRLDLADIPYSCTFPDAENNTVHQVFLSSGIVESIVNSTPFSSAAAAHVFDSVAQTPALERAEAILSGEETSHSVVVYANACVDECIANFGMELSYLGILCVVGVFAVAAASIIGSGGATGVITAAAEAAIAKLLNFCLGGKALALVDLGKCLFRCLICGRP
ncbi:MAG TPA: hypothetical protein VHI93_06545 [Candidatus Thermoplasmatota archaeon]|nr:hypothetical protein [Candidatus Thermoplasmatota archaeon]